MSFVLSDDSVGIFVVGLLKVGIFVAGLVGILVEPVGIFVLGDTAFNGLIFSYNYDYEVKIVLGVVLSYNDKGAKG